MISIKKTPVREKKTSILSQIINANKTKSSKFGLKKKQQCSSNKIHVKSFKVLCESAWSVVLYYIVENFQYFLPLRDRIIFSREHATSSACLTHYFNHFQWTVEHVLSAHHIVLRYSECAEKKTHTFLSKKKQDRITLSTERILMKLSTYKREAMGHV